MAKKIVVKDIEILVNLNANDQDYLSLTDIARYRSASETDDIIKNWMRNRSTLELLGLWEKINNPHFKPVEFDGFKNEAGSNSFVMSVNKWVKTTDAIGIYSKPGRYHSGTFAHKDIAFEFASWLSPEFKLYLIKEFQRLKTDEQTHIASGWDIKRTLAKINYKIHTDAIKQNLIPPQISKIYENLVYANEADVLNMALFGMTAKDWRDKNPKLLGNIRDYSSIEQLIILTNLESFNAELIKQNLPQSDRLKRLNKTAISQMKSLLGLSSVKRLKTGSRS